MAFMRILMDLADGFREGLVVGEPEKMPNVNGKYIIRVKPMGIQGLFSTYDITSIPENGWLEWKRPDGNITFILLMNESGKSPLLDKIGVKISEAIQTIENQNKIMGIMKSVEIANSQLNNQDEMRKIKQYKAIFDEMDKKNNRDKDPRFAFRGGNV